MDRATRQALSRINRHFYRRRATTFSRTRNSPWVGWQRVVSAAADRGLGRTGAAGDAGGGTALDVGCGNGRFGALLLDRLGPTFGYLGLDASPPLLADADRRLAALPRRRLIACELVERPPPLADPAELTGTGGRFDLVALFGLLHHLPGRQARCRLVVELARRVDPGGLLALSIWRFGDLPRFRRRAIPWREAPRHPELAGLAVPAPEQVEEGDHLLPWGECGWPRYCHHLSAEEEAELIAAVPLPLADRYDADGREGDLNRYLLFGG